MSSPNLSFNCAIVTGGGGGLGRAIAEYFLSIGKKVILVGRTESNLKEAAQSMGKGTAYYVLDTGKIKDIPAFVEKVTTEHPEVDCIVNNAGVQKPLKIKEFDLATADQEIDINIRGPMHLAIGLLPHLQRQPDGGVIMNVSSVLGFVPSSIINPVYNGTKAWVHFWTMTLRTQLADTKVRVVEIVPPSVSTALHRDRDDPDDSRKAGALSVEDFMADFKKGMQEGRDTVGAGPAIGLIEKWNGQFLETYDTAARKYTEGSA